MPTQDLSGLERRDPPQGQPALRRSGPAGRRRRPRRSVPGTAAHLPDGRGPLEGRRRGDAAAGRLGPSEAGPV